MSVDPWNLLIKAAAAAVVLLPLGTTGGPAVLDLAGEWHCRLDPDDGGTARRWYDTTLPETVTLPGSLAENDLGHELSVDTAWTGRIVDRSWFTDPEYAAYRKPGNIKIPFWLAPVKHYVGRAWYARPVTIPEAWRGKRITLFLERCHWETCAWVDGTTVGTRNSLSVAHEYDLSRVMTPGTHRLVVSVDNRVKINVGVNAHSVSDHTQSNWNGMVGALRLEARDPVWIDAIQVYPDIEGKRVKVLLSVGNTAGREISGTLTVKSRSTNGPRTHVVPDRRLPFTAPQTRSVVHVTYPMGRDVLLWDEFAPNLYELTASIHGEGFADARAVTFGMRSFAADGTRFTINGRPVFLRGTLECCIFPLTGYPAMDVQGWTRILKRARAHGLNHLRFHSWCPPEAAFAAADRLGMMYHVECGAWTTVGAGAPIDEFIYAEGDRILEAYGNHPSFCMLAYGNEPGGRNQRRFLGDLVTYWKKKDPRRLYTSAAGWPIIPENQFHSTPGPRVHQWGAGLRCRFNAKPPETMTDYRDFVGRYTVPVVSHEIGQWCVYPNLREIAKYTGVLKARNFEIFRDTLRANHMLDEAEDFLMASGSLQTLCYKEEIEAALRTPGFGGFQLLDLHDFPGQGTALVGVLDAFWDSKGYVTPEAFHRFSCETVPLARMEKRIWVSGETFTAAVEIAHFGPAPLAKARPVWNIRGKGGRHVASGRLPMVTIPVGNGFPLGTIRVPLRDRQAAEKLTLTVALAETRYTNDWDVWVYPARVDLSVPAGILISDFLNDAAIAALKDGGTVLLMPAPRSVKGDALGRIPAGFSSIFWNTAWTRRQAPHTLGILCDPEHPALLRFPTESHSNWQWWDLMTKSQAMILNGFPPALRPVVQVIDDWFTNRRLGLVFEARAGGGKLLVCSIDLRTDLDDRPVARQLFHSLLAYMESPAFSPEIELALGRVRGLQRAPSIMARARVRSASRAAPGYEAENAIDGDPATIWHTAWEGDPPGYPHELCIDLGRPCRVAGFRYLPRQDMANGWIARYEFSMSADGASWGTPVCCGTFRKGTSECLVMLDKGAGYGSKHRYVKLVAVTPHDPRHIVASIAEFEIIPGEK